MAFAHILVLALIQGLTEFLPISSSGHLVLAGQLLGGPDQGLAMDVAVHVGSLFAVMLYFWRDMGRLLIGFGQLLLGRGGPGPRLVVALVVASLPVFAAGYFAKPWVELWLRNIEVIAWAGIVFALLLWIADRAGMTIRQIGHLDVPGALFIGCMQCLALIPGASRAGVCMMAGRILGLERMEAARFSMLLSIPAILGAGSLIGWEQYQRWQETGMAGMAEFTAASPLDLLLAAGIAFVASFAAIAGMLAWLRHSGFAPFVIYRCALGIGLLLWVNGVIG